MMLEKARIHRAMLRIDSQRGFTVAEIADVTGAAIATIRKNLDRDVQAQRVTMSPGMSTGEVGRPERLYRMTDRGRWEINQEINRAYDAFPPLRAEPELEPATLTAGRQTLKSLRDMPFNRVLFLRRLKMAQEELSEAILTGKGITLHAAERLQAVATSAVKLIELTPENEQSKWMAVKDEILKRVEKALEGNIAEGGGGRFNRFDQPDPITMDINSSIPLWKGSKKDDRRFSPPEAWWNIGKFIFEPLWIVLPFPDGNPVRAWGLQ